MESWQEIGDKNLVRAEKGGHDSLEQNTKKQKENRQKKKESMSS